VSLFPKLRHRIIQWCHFGYLLAAKTLLELFLSMSLMPLTTHSLRAHMKCRSRVPTQRRESHFAKNGHERSFINSPSRARKKSSFLVRIKTQSFWYLEKNTPPRSDWLGTLDAFSESLEFSEVYQLGNTQLLRASIVCRTSVCS